MKIPAAGALALMLAVGAAAWAAKTDGVRQLTYWDQIMQAQSRKWMSRGSEQMRQGKYEDAVEQFAKAAVADPEDPQAHRLLGVSYYWAGRVDQAEIEIRESLRLEPKSSQGHLLLGIIQAWKGELELAYSSFKRASRIEPERADIQMNLGSMEETLGMYPEALAHFRKAAELDKKHPLYHFQLGMIYRRLGREEEAIDSMRQAIRLFPGFEDAMLELGAIYERIGRKTEALRMFEKSVRLKERDSVARFRLARLYLDQGKTEKARAVLREVFHLTPADQLGGLALSLSFGGKPTGGGEEAKPNPAAPDESTPGAAGPLDVLKRNLERIPLDQDAVLNADVVFLSPSKLVERERREGPSSLKNALERAGKVPSGTTLGAQREFQLAAGSAEARARQIAEVVNDLREVLDTAPPGAETRFGMKLNFTSAAKGAAGAKQGKKAKVAYQPRDVGNDMGLWVKGTGWMILVDEQLTQRGETMAHADSADWWSVEGIGLAIMGRAERAAAAFAEALRLDAGNELAHLGIGVTRVISGDEEGAVAAYRRALEINPKNRAAADGLKWLLRKPAGEEEKP
ncbi:MAG: tetratricopeptide repeat protein [Elusimicrobiota bacterium]